MKSILNITAVTAKYDVKVSNSKPVISDICLSANQKQVVGILGRNGAGKSTLLRTIAGLLIPLSGVIELNGKNITGFEPREIINDGLSFVAQGRECFLDLTVSENIKAALLPLKLSLNEIKDKIKIGLNYFESLRENENVIVRKLSGGVRQMLVIAMALVKEPLCTLMDEPSVGLSSSSINEMKKLITGYINNGGCILLVEQKPELINDLADFTYFMNNGKFSLSGKPKEIFESDLFKEQYLGISAN